MDGEAELVADLVGHRGFDAATRQRGWAYARGGHVVQLEHELDAGVLVVSGVVEGTHRYSTYLTAHRVGSGAVALDSVCSCPMAYECKHVYALVATLHEQRTRRPPHWRAVLDAVLDEAAAGLDPPAQPPSPVAVELVLPKPGPARRFGPDPDRAARVEVRVLRRGAGKRWVRGGMEWARIGNLPPGGPWAVPPQTASLDPADLDALTELKLAVLGRRGYLASSYDALDLHGAGPGLWRALDRLAERGIPLLCSDKTVAVRVATRPATTGIDVAARDGAVAVSPGWPWKTSGRVPGRPPPRRAGARRPGAAAVGGARRDRCPARRARAGPARPRGVPCAARLGGGRRPS